MSDNTDARAGDILVIDEEPDIRALLVEFLRGERYQVRMASTVAEAMLASADRRPALLLLDGLLPNESEIAPLADLCGADSILPLVLMTTSPPSVAPMLMTLSVACLEKPFDLSTMLTCVASHVLRERTV